MTTRTNLSGGRKTEEQRRLVAVTAVEVVSRLALEIGRDDVSVQVKSTRCAPDARSSTSASRSCFNGFAVWTWSQKRR